MDPKKPALGRGRARGIGRGVFQHPPPINPDLPRREPYRDAPIRPPAPAPGRSYIGIAKHPTDPSSTMISSEGSSGRGVPTKMMTLSRTSGSDPTKHMVYPEPRADNLRGHLRPEVKVPLRLLYTRPTELKSKCGTSGQAITCEANYFRLKHQPTWRIYQYRVDFQPDVEDIKHRRYLIAQCKLGGFLFDGTMLFVTGKIDDSDDVVEKMIMGRDNETPYRMLFKFTALVSTLESSSIQVLNLILRSAMKGLNLQMVGRNLYDPLAQIVVRELQLSIWPGYITSIRQHEEDILLCAEISHKIMRDETVLHILTQVKQENRDFKLKAEQALLGLTVLTAYNNKTYRIDDIKWDKTPESTFEKDGKQISFIQYFGERYKLNIRDRGQPLLLTRPKLKDIRGKQLKPGETAEEEKETLLVPELCRATGLTDSMRSNFRTMKELNRYTKIGPADRIQRLLKFANRLTTCAESVDHLTRWNLELDQELIKIPGRILPYPKLIFGNNKTVGTDMRVDWTREFRYNTMHTSIELKRWYVLCTSRGRNVTDAFIGALQKAGSGMSMKIAPPRIVECEDRITELSNTLKESASKNPQLIMCVVSNNNSDRYGSIKKRCYCDFGIPSQVIVQKTITPKDPSKGPAGLLSVATKVAIQMNCKLGGIPWLIEMPLDGLMTMGYDVCHDPQDKKYSWGALVATMDLKAHNTQFFSAVDRHSKDIEMSNNLKTHINRALTQYKDINQCLPKRILLYRDGVGDGQVSYVYENELVTIKEGLKEFYKNHGHDINVPFMYIIVSKRINTRIFFDKKNPQPGTCVDDVVTLPERYDFFLIPQTVREGTVTPSGFNIIENSMGLPPDRIQILTFRFTFFYFNWSGTVRVPALCQYAHKLAFLASQSMRTSLPQNGLERTLYFL